MRLNRTGANWDRLERNKMNENWDIIEGVITDAVGTISDDIIQEVLDRVLEGAHVEWKGVINTYNDLPVDPEIGDTYFVKDSGITYRWSGDSWIEIQEINPSIYEQLEQEISDLSDALADKADKSELDSAIGQVELQLEDKADKIYVDDKLSKIYGLSNDVVNIYVDSTLGSDDNNGTSVAPFKTIQKAFDNIPKIINKDHIIHCAPGVYDEEAYITGVLGAAVMLRAWSDNVPPVDQDIACRVRALRFYDMMGYVHIGDFGSYSTPNIESRACFLFSRCVYASVSRCRFTSNTIGTTKRTIEWDGSKGSVGTSYFGSQHICVLSVNGSSVRTDATNQAGSGNNYALFAQSGLIFKKGDNTWINNANTPEREHEGGKIF